MKEFCFLPVLTGTDPFFEDVLLELLLILALLLHHCLSSLTSDVLFALGFAVIA